MRKFISIKDTTVNNGTIFINLEQISHIFVEGKTIIMAGNHGSYEGSNGILHLTEEDMKKVMEYL